MRKSQSWYYCMQWNIRGGKYSVKSVLSSSGSWSCWTKGSWRPWKSDGGTKIHRRRSVFSPVWEIKWTNWRKNLEAEKILNCDVHVLRRVRRPTTTVGGSPSTTLAASSSSSSSGSVSPSSLLQLNTGQSHFLHFFLSPFPGDLIGSFPMVCGSYLFCPGTTSIKPHQRELALSR